MAKIDVHDLSGKKTGSFELAEEVFGAVNEDLLWEAVKHFRARLRAGTHATKNRKLVSGSGKKLWRQKGTGRARVGSIRSPLWRHGGTVHGPQPRSYDYQFPRKKLLGALRSALAAKVADGKLIVVENFDLAEAKTAIMREALDSLKVGKTTLLITVGSADANRNLELSSRNLEGVELLAGNHVHPYHLLRYESAVFALPALERLQNALRPGAATAGKSQNFEEEKEAAKPARRARAKKAAAKSRGGQSRGVQSRGVQSEVAE